MRLRNAESVETTKETLGTEGEVDMKLSENAEEVLETLWIEIEEGKKEGILEGKQAVALELLKQGVDLEIIIKSIGLTKEQVKKLNE